MNIHTLRASYHGGHSGDFCDHALDTKEQMLEAYVDAGYTHVAITEHLPPTNDSFLYPEEINKNHSADYIKERFEMLFSNTRPILTSSFSDKFVDLRFGFETEFYTTNISTNPTDWIITNIKKHNPDIVVASVHHVHNIPIDYDATLYQNAITKTGSLEALYCAYYDHQYDLIKALSPYSNKCPIILGHMDLIRLMSNNHIDIKNTDSIWSRIKRNIKAATDANMIIEVNSRALKKGLSEPYPSKNILQEIKLQGGQITTSDDSHCVSDIGALHKETIEYISTVFDDIAVMKARAYDKEENHVVGQNA